MNKQERLYDINQLAKAIFVIKAANISFVSQFESQVTQALSDSFTAAEAFFEEQEKYVDQRK